MNKAFISRKKAQKAQKETSLLSGRFLRLLRLFAATLLP